jgi:hypothetical protein
MNKFDLDAQNIGENFTGDLHSFAVNGMGRFTH